MKFTRSKKALNRIRTLQRMVRSRLRWRKSLREWNAYSKKHPQHGAPPAEVVVYFADRKVNMYQIRQWYEPLEHLATMHPVTIITRSPTVSNILVGETNLGVSYHRTMAGVENWLMKQRVGVVLYVNQNTRNFQMLRFHVPAHIHISHGESEKVSMVSNQLKAYDYAFVAGQASVDRIQNRLIDAPDNSRLKIVGRPQIDVRARDLDITGQKIILYAPTWEGDRPAMGYSSLLSHGLEMVKQITTDPSISVIYRPHPRTGAVNEAYRTASLAIKNHLNSINTESGSPRHIVDEDIHFGWQLKNSDVVIADISSVAYDALATHTPLLLTPPREEAEKLESKILESASFFSVDDINNIAGILTDPTSESYCRVDADLLDYYYAATQPGEALELFANTVDQIWKSREDHMPLPLEEDAGLDEDLYTDIDLVVSPPSPLN